MIRTKRSLVLVALFAVLALVLAACGGSSSKTGSKPSGGGTTGGKVPTGGTLVLGAEQEPDCADWIASCAGASWGLYTIQEHTMPRVFDYVKKNGAWTEVPSPLLAAMPVATTKGGKQVVTYKLNPKAVWSDGEPITSTDFKYTWTQIATGEDIYDKTGYQNIESVDASSPATVVVTFTAADPAKPSTTGPYASWKALFAGLYGVFPSHLLEGKDRDAEMANGYSWSGGPWIAKWDKGVQVTLTPNARYWGEKPKLDKVIFKFLADTAAEFAAFKSNEVSAIYPQPQLDAVTEIQGGLSGANSYFTADTGNVEALWVNNAKAPFDSKAVRQAFAYAISRDVIVNRLFGALGVKKAVQTLNPPILSKYADLTAYSNYKLNLSKVNSLMQGDGWTKNASGIWEKGGQAANLEIKSTAGNKRRELTEQILQEQLKAAGFSLTISNQKAGDLFGTQLPAGDYQLSLYAQVATSLDPGLCSIACSANIPTDANGNAGQNWQRIDVAALDPLLRKVDTSIDDSVRVKSSKAADKVMAEDQVSLPLDPLPNILLWSKKIVGPVADNPVLGMFWNVNQWGVKA